MDSRSGIAESSGTELEERAGPATASSPPSITVHRCRRLAGELRVQVEAIYRDSFPPEEREDLDGLVSKVSRGEAVLYLAQVGSILVGFALVLPLEVEGVYLLDYLAVDRAHRNHGIGRSLLTHLKRVLGRCPKASGIMLEVESDDWGAEAERHLRARRIAFYGRNGAVPIPLRSHLRVPSMAGCSDLYTKLLWIPLADPPPVGAKLGRCLRSFLNRAYGMSADDPLVLEALRMAGDNRPELTVR